MAEIDCRGKTCPQPVLMAKQALETLREGELTLIVDDPSSCENVERFVRSQGCVVNVEKEGRDFYLHIKKMAFEEEGRSSQRKEKVVVYISSQLLGIGDEALGRFLMRAFLNSLLNLETPPSRLILINSGVHLASEDSEVVDTLKALADQGMEILSCGTCLEFYSLKEKMGVGRISNMFEIVQSLLEADRVIRP